MTINENELRQLAATIRAEISPTMSSQAFAVAQSKADLINKTIAAIERAHEAWAIADVLKGECEKWV
jgi:hypothetical protein